MIFNSKFSISAQSRCCPDWMWVKLCVYGCGRMLLMYIQSHQLVKIPLTQYRYSDKYYVSAIKVTRTRFYVDNKSAFLLQYIFQTLFGLIIFIASIWIFLGFEQAKKTCMKRESVQNLSHGNISDTQKFSEEPTSKAGKLQ